VANETFSKNIGVSWKQHTYTESGAGGAGGTFNGQGDVKFPLDTDDAGKFTISSAAGTSSFGVGLGATSRSQIFAKIDLAEINGQSKTIASPRLIVNNNSPANIIDGTTITVPVSGGTGAAGSFKDIIAALSLTVTPQVTSHGSVQLKNLTVTKNAVGTPVNGNVSVNNKSIVTDVLVDSGATLVLGGVFQAESQATVAGIPLLKDLPFIGQLFRTDSKSSTKSELMVFITPQILDPEAPSQTL
jgi:type IV pilus assembly protein PilQ